MLKALLLLMVSFCLITAHSDKPLPNLSFGFCGTFIRNTTESSVLNYHSTQHDVKFNPNDQAAFVSITSLQNDDDLLDQGLFWLLHQPQGGPSNFFGVNVFVLFQQINDTDSDDSYCSYSSYFVLGPDFQPPGTFPSEWQDEDGNMQLYSWFSFPSTLKYSGIREYGGITVDLWEDTQYCTLFGYYTLPCFTVATRVDQAVPVFVERAHQRRQGSFELDWIQRDEWQSFLPSNPTITPPTSWCTTCYNTDNGINIQPVRGYVATPLGCDNFTVSLTAPPPSGKSVRTMFVPVSGCTYCTQFQTVDGSPLPELVFTEYDWNVPQRVYVRYLFEGEVEYTLVATGGGYEIENLVTGVPLGGTVSEMLRILTCEGGVPGFGC